MPAIDQAFVSKILNASTPTGTGGIPGTSLAALNSGTMYLKLTSTASSAASSGTEIANGGGYTTNGNPFATASTASSSGSSVLCPAGAALSWANSSGSPWSIQSLEITDHVQLRVWFGNWTGAAIAVANGNTFQVAINAITIALS